MSRVVRIDQHQQLQPVRHQEVQLAREEGLHQHVVVVRAAAEGPVLPMAKKPKTSPTRARGPSGAISSRTSRPCTMRRLVDEAVSIEGGYLFLRAQALDLGLGFPKRVFLGTQSPLPV